MCCFSFGRIDLHSFLSLLLAPVRLIMLISWVVVALVPSAAHAQSSWEDGDNGDIYYDGGNVGIGTSAPSTMLHVKEGAFVVEGSVGDITMTGSGTRLMFVPSKKGAFRAGNVLGGDTATGGMLKILGIGRLEWEWPLRRAVIMPRSHWGAFQLQAVMDLLLSDLGPKHQGNIQWPSVTVQRRLAGTPLLLD